MCLQISSKYCKSTTRVALFACGFSSLVLAISIGYLACTIHAFYNDIDPQAAQAKSLSYHLQLATSGYLVLLTILSCFAAHYKEKHSLRALAVISTLNVVLALAVIFVLRPHHDLSKPFVDTLQDALGKYDKANREPAPTVAPALATALPLATEKLAAGGGGGGSGAPASAAEKPKSRRYAETETEKSADAKAPKKELTKEEATRIWDRLQSFGCCGLNNGTSDWGPSIPKSCCAQPVDEGGLRLCKEIDAGHNLGCLALIDRSGSPLHLLIVLIGFINMQLLIISGLNIYKTYRYNEASQSAYT